MNEWFSILKDRWLLNPDAVHQKWTNNFDFKVILLVHFALFKMKKRVKGKKYLLVFNFRLHYWTFWTSFEERGETLSDDFFFVTGYFWWDRLIFINQIKKWQHVHILQTRKIWVFLIFILHIFLVWTLHYLKKNAHENIRSILSCFGHCKCCSKTLLQSSTQMNLVFLCIHAFSQKWAVALKSLQLFCLKMKHDSGAY